MNAAAEVTARQWGRQDAAWLRPPPLERVADSADRSRGDARQVAALERALQGLNFSEGPQFSEGLQFLEGPRFSEGLRFSEEAVWAGRSQLVGEVLQPCATYNQAREHRGHVGDLAGSWCVVRKRQMKRARLASGASEAARREAVRRFLKKRRAGRIGAGRRAERVRQEATPMEEGPL
eukprot:evm.model.scf_754.4 EVM.evm.TU.scf_754.4   scf_754:49550-50083(+)